MAFDKLKYWKEKPNNIGSKRPKPTFIESVGKTIIQLGSKISIVSRREARYKQPDVRNTKKHRDQRTAEHGKYLAAIGKKK